MEKPYKPIDCNLYDELVLLAMHKKPVILLPNPCEDYDGEIYISDLVTKDKEEFMVLSNGYSLRLDKIEALDEHVIFVEE